MKGQDQASRTPRRASTYIQGCPERCQQCSVRRFIAPGPGPLQLLDCLQNAEPHPPPLHVAAFQKGIGAHGSVSRRILLVLFDEQVGGAVDVEGGVYLLQPSGYSAGGGYHHTDCRCIYHPLLAV